MPLRMECAPAFDYARAAHTTALVPDDSIPDITSPTAPSSSPHVKALFTSAALALDLRYVVDCTAVTDAVRPPAVRLAKLDLRAQGHRGEGACADLALEAGQVVTFVLRVPPERAPPPQAKPTRAQAQALGVPIESAFSRGVLERQDTDGG